MSRRLCSAWLRTVTLVFAALLIVSGGSVLTSSIDKFGVAAFADGTDSSSDSSASGDSGAGSTADADTSADASATNSGGDPSATATGTASGDATGGDTAASGDISATASATGGDEPEATTSTSAGTEAGAKISNVKSVYADGPLGTKVYKKEGQKKGYAVAVYNGAYSAAYYKRGTVGAFSGIYTNQKLTAKGVKAFFNGKVAVGAWANRYEAGAYADANAYGEGWNKSNGAKAKSGAYAFAWVNKRGQTVGETTGYAAAWAGERPPKAARRSNNNFVGSSCQGSRWRWEFRKRCRIWD